MIIGDLDSSNSGFERISKQTNKIAMKMAKEKRNEMARSKMTKNRKG